MQSRSIKQFLQCKSTIISVIYFITELKEGLENLNESRRVLSKSPLALKKTSMSSNKISCLQALQYLLYALSRLKQSFSFSWWTVTSLYSKNVLQLPYWKSRARGTSRHIVCFSYKKRWLPPLPVGLSWDSPHPPPESVRTYVRWRQNQNFSDQRVTKFAYPWCSAGSAIN